MAIQKIQNGASGAQASQTLYDNDMEASELRDWAAGTYTRNQKAVVNGSTIMRVKNSVASTTQNPGTAGQTDWEAVGGESVQDIRNALDYFLKAAGSVPVDTSGFEQGLTNNAGVLVSNENLFATLREIPTEGKQYVFFDGYPMYTVNAGYNTILGRRQNGTFGVIAPSFSGDPSPATVKVKITQSYPISDYVALYVTVSVAGNAAGYPTTVALADNNSGLNSVKNYIDAMAVKPSLFPPRDSEMSLDMGVNGVKAFVAYNGYPTVEIRGVQAGIALVNAFRYIGFEVHNLQANTVKPTITELTLRLMECNERTDNADYSRLVVIKEVTVTGLNITAGTSAIVVFDIGEIVRANNFLSVRLTSPQNFRIAGFANAPASVGNISNRVFQPASSYEWLSPSEQFTAWCTVGLTNELKARPRIIFNRAQIDEQALNMPKHEGIPNLGRLSLRNQYAIGGRRLRLYTNSIYSGLNPMNNYRLRVYDNDMASERFRGDFYMYTPPAANGQWLVRAQVYDQVRALLADKMINIYYKPQPTQLIDTAPDYPVWFFGDSLIWFNGNLIGKEFLRLMNTVDENETVQPDGSVLTPTIGLTNQMRLVGAQLADDGVTRWSTINALYTHVMNLDSPMCNPASTQPRELDAQGFPRQMDLVWYLQQLCGQGKYPKFICFGIGVNDIAIKDNWSDANIKEIVNWVRIFIGKIKDACDVIAGGTSTVSIAQIVHQYYPNNRGNYGRFESDYQHRSWTYYYDLIEQMIASASSDSGKKLSNFCRLIDASSRFDIDHGYTYVPIRVNDRLDVMGDYVLDTVHMGVNGAYQYADAIADNFMYHNCQ